MLCLPGMLLARPPIVLVLGDSLSAGYGIDPAEGWVSLLQQRIRETGYPHQVVNASISGDTTRGGLARLPRALEKHAPSILIIELGANDGLRGFQTSAIGANLRAMVDLGREAGARVLLLGMKMPPNYGARFTEQFHRVYLDVAAETSVFLVPFFLEGITESPGLMQEDGVHPNALAQPRMLENVWPSLAPLFDSGT